MKNIKAKSVIVTPETIAVQITRFAAICPMLEFARQLAAGKSPRWQDGSNIFSTMEELSRHLALLNGVSRRTIWRWYSLFLHEGYSGLRRQARADKGRSRFFVRHFRSAALVIEMSIRSERSAFSIHKELLRSGETTPNYATTKAFVDSLRGSQKKLR